MSQKRKFGLQSTFVTPEQEAAILTEMGWDAKSIPYPVIAAWFEQKVEAALAQVLKDHPAPTEVKRALSEELFNKIPQVEKKPRAEAA